MSTKKPNNWHPPVVKFRTKKKKRPSVRKSSPGPVCSTSWFASPGDLATDHLEAPGNYSYFAKGSEQEFTTSLKSSREFGSTGDLLRTPGKISADNPFKKYLGKSLEQLPTTPIMSSEVGPFRTETGNDCRKGEICNLEPISLHNHALLENPESETRWYFKYFLGKYHLNYLCYDLEKNPLFISIVPSDSLYRCILWKKTGNKRLCVKHSSNRKWPSPKSILEKYSIKADRSGIKEIHSPSIQKDLLTLEEQEGSVNFKFGVLYAKTGQQTDNEMYSNEHGDKRFQQFLELLGDEVQLKGWKQFRGGLDCKNDSTGLSSIYTVYEGHEIMFHVSTLLPYTTANEQQLERKRHIGNDIVVIIYVGYDSDPEEAYQSAITDFSPNYMKSHFNHIFALVTYDHIMESYSLVVHSAESVPAFGPFLPQHGKFADFSTFRDFLLAKLINGEKAAYCTPTFSQKRERTLGLLLKEVETNSSQEMRRAPSSPSLSHSHHAKKHHDVERVFTEFGQRLKVDKIITGLHPTSQLTTGAIKKEPWETECVTDDFPYKICCGDIICDDGTLIASTHSNGTYFIFKDGSYSLIMDKSISVGQLAVAHKHQLLLFRTNHHHHHKDINYLYAIPLRDFYSNEIIRVADRASISHYQVPYSKGITLFCTSPLTDQFLRLAVAVKNKIFMIAYKHPASMIYDGLDLTPSPSTDPKENFIKHRELSLWDVPVQMTLLDERPSGKICVTYQKLTVIDAIDEISATTQRIPNLDISKTKLTTLTSVQTNGRSELLIGYNLTCRLITLHDNTAYNSVEIVWNIEPQDLVYLSPYMLAFTEHALEIRMSSNGSLMQTIDVPDLHLLTSKGDIYFTSSSSLVHTTSSKTPTAYRRFSNIPPATKLPKNMDKKDLLVSLGRFSENEENTYVYKISMENMTGRPMTMESNSGLGSTVSLKNSSSEESVSKTEAEIISIVSSDDCNSDGSAPYIHPPEVADEDIPPFIRTSFDGDESPPLTSPYRKAISLVVNSDTSSSFQDGQSSYHDDHGDDCHHTAIESNGHYAYESHDNMATSQQLSVNSNGHKSSSLSPPHTRLKRSRKVLTGRKSLDSGSRWLYPDLLPSSVDKPGGCRTNDMPEILGLLENVVYSSPELSPSSNDYSESNGVNTHN